MTLKTLRQGILVFENAGLANPQDFSKKELEDIWFSCLKHLSKKQYMLAVKKIIQTSVYFPKIADVIAAIPTGRLSGPDAWEVVQVEMNRCCGAPGIFPVFKDKTILDLVMSMGGLRVIWQDEYGRQKFIKAYNQKISETRLLAGSGAKELEGK